MAGMRRGLDPNHIIAIYDGERMEFIRRHKRQIVELGDIAIPKSATEHLGTAEELLVRRIAESATPVVLRMDQSLGLICYDRLPQSARADLNAITAHKLDTLTPWPADKVVHHAEPIDLMPDGLLLTRILVVPRRLVDKAVEALAILGLTPAAVDMSIGDDVAAASFDFLGVEHVRSEFRPMAMVAILGVLALAGLGGYFAYKLEQTGTALAERGVVADGLRQKLSDFAALREKLDTQKNQADAIAERRRDQPSVLLAINDVARVLPDTAWLQRLAINGREASLTGFAEDAEILLSVFEADMAFSAAEFTAANRTQTVSVAGTSIAGESFSIEFQLLGEGTVLPNPLVPALSEEE